MAADIAPRMSAEQASALVARVMAGDATVTDAEWQAALWWHDGRLLPSSCSHGCSMPEKGRGAYPYPCGAKDKYPRAMVYSCEEHGVWNYDPTTDSR